jgi:opacity protein-like surface antigen
MHLNRLTIVTLAFGGLALLPIAAKAQSGFGQRATVGIFGGVTIPRSDFSIETKLGAHAGALAKMRLYRLFDLRVDGAWNKFGEKNIPQAEGVNATVESYAKVIFGTANVVLNLGPDSSSYPGDNSVSPYIMAGAGGYNVDYGAECSGQCTGFSPPETKTHLGLNAGFGANATFGILKPFIEARYHRISKVADDGTSRSMYTISVGLKLR